MKNVGEDVIFSSLEEKNETSFFLEKKKEEVDRVMDAIAFEGMKYVMTRLNFDRLREHSRQLLDLYCSGEKSYYSKMCFFKDDPNPNPNDSEIPDWPWQTMPTSRASRASQLFDRISDKCPFLKRREEKEKKWMSQVFGDDLQVQQLERQSSLLAEMSYDQVMQVVKRRVDLLYARATPQRREWFVRVVAQPDVRNQFAMFEVESEVGKVVVVPTAKGVSSSSSSRLSMDARHWEAGVLCVIWLVVMSLLVRLCCCVQRSTSGGNSAKK